MTPWGGLIHSCGTDEMHHVHIQYLQAYNYHILVPTRCLAHHLHMHTLYTHMNIRVYNVFKHTWACLVKHTHTQSTGTQRHTHTHTHTHTHRQTGGCEQLDLPHANLQIQVTDVLLVEIIHNLQKLPNITGCILLREIFFLN